MKVKPTLLPIDECEEWICEILDYTKDSHFEYITDEGKDFLIFNTNDFKCRFKGIIQDKKDYWNEIGTVQYRTIAILNCGFAKVLSLTRTAHCNHIYIR